jgi:uncharacterized membrane protein SpoIIM required for sporulation
LDLDAFAARERGFWEELDRTVRRLEEDPALVLDVAQVERVHYLYRRAVSALARIDSLPRENDFRKYLEALVARAHMELYDRRARMARFRPLGWLLVTVPATFRRHFGAFAIAGLVTLVGAGFGATALVLDPDAKATLLPFSNLHGSPNERVKKEEAKVDEAAHAHHSSFAAELMVNNISVSIRAFAFGIFYQLGTLVLLFYNGVVLGAVALDYVRAGETRFLLGWLLPHGAFEIPAILIAGQAGLVLGRAVIGFGNDVRFVERLRQVGPDLVTLVAAAALMLVWAGIVESFFSQYHEPVLPYPVKIAFGVSELALLFAWLRRGRRDPSGKEPARE